MSDQWTYVLTKREPGFWLKWRYTVYLNGEVFNGWADIGAFTRVGAVYAIKGVKRRHYKIEKKYHPYPIHEKGVI